MSISINCYFHKTPAFKLRLETPSSQCALLNNHQWLTG